MNERGKLTVLVRKALPYLTVALIIAAGYDAWVFGSRWNDARKGQKAAIRQQGEEGRREIELLGGDRLKILNFYASPPTIRRGDRSLLCYGVNAAERVRIEPAVEELHPAISHCLTVSPTKSTDYKLFAEDRGGHTVTASVTIQVR